MDYKKKLCIDLVGAARTHTPSTTNYDVHSPTWGDDKPVLLPSAMEATNLGHDPSWSAIDPVQVSITTWNFPAGLLHFPDIFAVLRY